MQIWGQEPTITLPYLANNWDKWIDTFPNLEKIFFSTNMMGEPDSIIFFMEQINKYAKDTPIRFELQVSYDGQYGTNNYRKADADTIKNNCVKIIEYFNKMIFKENVNFSMFFHGVTSNQLINDYLFSIDNIKEYLREIDNFIYDIRKLSMNKHVIIGNITLQYENGNEYTTEMGIKLAECANKIQRTLDKNNFKVLNEKDYPYTFELLGGTTEFIRDRILQSPCNTIDEYIDFYINNLEEYKRYYYCAPIIGDLKIMYDGTLLECQNSIYDKNMLKDEVKLDIASQSRWILHDKFQINLLTENDEHKKDTIINTYQKLIFDGNVQYFMINNISNFLYNLAQVGQVDKSYLKNPYKLRRHAFYLSFINSCHYNLIRKSGSMIMRNLSDVRLLCNGLLDQYDEQLKYYIEEIRNNE